MDEISVNLTGAVCPYPVMVIIEHAEKLKPGESVSFVVDDPLAIKSVPEELEDDAGIDIAIETCKEGWKITVAKSR